MALTLLHDGGRAAAARAVAEGLLDPVAHAAGRAVLTDRGRLLADRVVTDLLIADEEPAATGPATASGTAAAWVR